MRVGVGLVGPTRSLGAGRGGAGAVAAFVAEEAYS